MLLNNKFIPYLPEYNPLSLFERTTTVASASIQAIVKSLDKNSKIGASVEITDKCNAGCDYCYVYPKDWDQKQRLDGYEGLDKTTHLERENQIIKIIEDLRSEGLVHITLVGGEPALALDAVHKAAELFPIVWLVTNGVLQLPALPNSVIVFVSIDGPANLHNKMRDPSGFYKNCKYKNLEGMSAKIVQNINESARGAFVHCTLTPNNIDKLPETVDWLVRDVSKLRGIVVSGATSSSKLDPLAFTVQDRKKLKNTIESLAENYGWQLFPFNQPKVNDILFNEENIITNPNECSISKRIKSLKYNGESTGKCILRDAADCETCICNMTGLLMAMESFDIRSIIGNSQSLFG
jgi:sulfatase maturation enzyme AslB (radical SAM superfamily)